jgi:hypothetical protein
MPYAQDTSVTVDRSMQELAALLTKHGASAFGFGSDADTRITRAQFRLSGRAYRIDVPMAEPGEFRKMRNGQYRDAKAAATAARKEDQRRWRSLLLVIKAILVAIDDGILRAEDALLAFTVLPDGQTMSQWAEPALETAYTTHAMPGVLPGSMIALEGRTHE